MSMSFVYGKKENDINTYLIAHTQRNDSNSRSASVATTILVYCSMNESRPTRQRTIQGTFFQVQFHTLIISKPTNYCYFSHYGN